MTRGSPPTARFKSSPSEFIATYPVSTGFDVGGSNVKRIFAAFAVAGLLLNFTQARAQEQELPSVLSVSPSTVGSNSNTTVLVRGNGFVEGDTVQLSGCPVTNPQAVYPVPQVQIVDATTMLVTTPNIIPAGTCTLTVGRSSLPAALTFADAPERLTVQITNDTSVTDEQLWITLGYNCPRAITSPPYPPGTDGCNVDGRSNMQYDWPPTLSGTNANKYWYEVYSDDSIIPAFTGIRFSDLAPVAGQAQTREFAVANIDSGVVYISQGSPVNTGASPIGRAPSYVTSKTRFDAFELTFHGSAQGSWASPVYANITAVAGVSMLMNLSGWDNSIGSHGPAPRQIGTGVSWRKGATTDGIVTTLRAAGVNVDDTSVVVTTDDKPYRTNNFLRIISPSTNGGSGYARLGGSKRSYLAWLTRQQKRFKVVGLYSGSGAGAGTWYCYRSNVFTRRSPTALTGSYGYATRAAARAASRSGCTATGTATAGPKIVTATTPVSGVAGSVTSAAVYMQDNRYLQDGVIATGNDLANAIYRDFIVSFAYGYWGSRSGSSGWTTLTWGTAKGSVPAFSPGWPAFKRGVAFPRWNAYAESIWKFTNAYGMPYSDTFGNGGRGNPLVSGSAISTLRLGVVD